MIGGMPMNIFMNIGRLKNRKAIRTDYQGAEYALEQCKIHQKEWKRRNKR